MYVYVYVYVYAYIYLCLCAYRYAHIHIYIYISIYIYTYMYINIYMYIHITISPSPGPLGRIWGWFGRELRIKLEWVGVQYQSSCLGLAGTAVLAGRGSGCINPRPKGLPRNSHITLYTCSRHSRGGIKRIHWGVISLFPIRPLDRRVIHLPLRPANAAVRARPKTGWVYKSWSTCDTIV